MRQGLLGLSSATEAGLAAACLVTLGATVCVGLAMLLAHSLQQMERSSRKGRGGAGEDSGGGEGKGGEGVVEGGGVHVTAMGGRAGPGDGGPVGVHHRVGVGRSPGAV